MLGLCEMGYSTGTNSLLILFKEAKVGTKTKRAHEETFLLTIGSLLLAAELFAYNCL